MKSGETGVLVDRLPPGRQCVETDADERALAVYLEPIEQAQAMDRQAVRQLSAEQFDTGSTVDLVIKTLARIRESAISDGSMPTRLPGCSDSFGLNDFRRINSNGRQNAVLTQ